MEGFSDGGGGPVSSLSLPRSEEEWVCTVRTLDHSQIPYFDEKQKYPTHTVGRVWVGWVVQSHSPGKVLVVLSQGNSPVRRDKYLPPPSV